MLKKYILQKYICENLYIEKICIEKTKICNWPYFRSYEVLDHGLLTKFDPNTHTMNTILSIGTIILSPHLESM